MFKGIYNVLIGNYPRSSKKRGFPQQSFNDSHWKESELSFTVPTGSNGVFLIFLFYSGAYLLGPSTFVLFLSPGYVFGVFYRIFFETSIWLKRIR